MARRKTAYRKRHQNRFSMFLVTLVVLMIMVVVAVRSVELQQKIAGYDTQSRPERNRSRNSVSTLRRKLMWKRWRRISWDWYTKVRSFFRKTIKQGNCFSTVNLLFLSQKMKSLPPSI